MNCPACGQPDVRVGVVYDASLATSYDPEEGSWSSVPTARVYALKETFFLCCGSELLPGDPLLTDVAGADMTEVVATPEWWDERNGRDELISG